MLRVFLCLSSAVAISCVTCSDARAQAEALCRATAAIAPVNAKRGVETACESKLPLRQQLCDALYGEIEVEAAQFLAIERTCYLSWACELIATSDGVSDPQSTWERCVEDLYGRHDLGPRVSPPEPARAKWSDAREQILGILPAVATRGGDQAFLLYDAVGRALPTWSAHDDVDFALSAVTAQVAAPSGAPCSVLTNEVTTYVREMRLHNVNSGAPMRRELIQEALQSKECAAKIVAEGSDPAVLSSHLEDLELVTVTGAPDDELTLIVGGEKQGVVRVPTERSVVTQGRRLFFAAVPRRAPLSLRLDPRRTTDALPMET